METRETAVGVIYSRKAPIRPKTFNDATRSVRVVATTGAPFLRRIPGLPLAIPVAIIKMLAGYVLPKSGQIPLLDSHNTSSVSAVLGSARNFQIVGDSLECDVYFAGTPQGMEAARKVKEGHLTDFSVGFTWDFKDTELIGPGASRVLGGKTIKGPALIISRWRLYELSLVMEGADPSAKARAADHLAFGLMAGPGDGPAPAGAPVPPEFLARALAPPEPGKLLDRAFWGLILFILLAALIGLWR